MEDDSEKHDEQQTPTKRRRYLRGNFLSSWLNRRRETPDQREVLDYPDSDDAEDEDTVEDRQTNRFDRLLAELRIALRHLTGFDRPQSLQESGSAQISNLSLGSELEDNVAVETDSYEDDSVAEPESDSNAGREGGLLPVSKEAINRFMKDSATEGRKASKDESVDGEQTDVKPDTITTSEETASTERRLLDRSDLPKSETETHGQALSAGDILRMQNQERLQRQVKKLKKQAASIKKEQHVVHKQQEVFEHKLDRQERINQAAVESYLPTPESIDLAPQNSTSNEQVANIAYEKVRAPELVPARGEILPKVQSSELNELIRPPLSIRPELILDRVEDAAEKNIAIESMYERRHEIKDEPAATAAQTLPPPMPISQALATSKLPHSGYRPPVPAPQPDLARPIVASSTVYKQAAQSGFWTGVVLCIFLLIMLLTH